MKNKVKLISITVIFILIVIGIYEIFSTFPAHSLIAPTQEQEINSLQEKIDNLVAQYPQLDNLRCRFRDTGNEISLACPTYGSTGSASGSIFESFNDTGVNKCIPDWNCTFYEYPKISPIKKSNDITIIKNDNRSFFFVACKFSGIQTNYFSTYTVLSMQSYKSQVDQVVENCLKAPTEDIDGCLTCAGGYYQDSSLCENATNKEWCQRQVATDIELDQ